MIIFYHNDPDGLTAAWLFHTKFPNAHYEPVAYGDFNFDCEEEDVIFLDYCPKRHVLLELAKVENREILVLDHHISAMQDCGDLEYCHFDVNKAGCRLAWEYLYGNVSSPWVVDYVEDRDIWKWELPNSLEVNASIQSYKLTFSDWYVLTRHPLDTHIADGYAIIRYQQRSINSHIKKAREINLAGYDVLAVECTDMCLLSDIAGELSEGRPFGVCYFESSPGYRTYSLRSRGDFDVSKLAKIFGGGGHKHAAGFRMPQ